MQSRIDETEVANAVEAYLYDAGGTATIAQIRRALPNFVQLSSIDQTPSQTRTGEQIWEQQVRNIVCHRNSAENPVNSGKFIWTPGRLTLRDSPQKSLF